MGSLENKIGENLKMVNNYIFYNLVMFIIYMCMYYELFKFIGINFVKFVIGYFMLICEYCILCLCFI